MLYKTFNDVSGIWTIAPDGVFLYTNDSRDVKNLLGLDDKNKILDALSSEGSLWVLCENSFYLMDMATRTVENIPLPESGISGAKLSADLDFVWITGNSKLWRFDKLGREWFSYSYPDPSQDSLSILGMADVEDKIFIATPGEMLTFWTKEEKWEQDLIPFSVISENAQALIDPGFMVIVDSTNLYRYTFSGKAWEKISESSSIMDVSPADTAIFYSTSQNIFSLNKSNFVSTPFDMSSLKDVCCFAKKDSVIYIGTSSRLLAYDPKSNALDYIENPGGNLPPLEKIVNANDQLILFHPGKISLYDIKNRIWQYYERQNLLSDKNKILWDENGFFAEYTQNYKSTLKGSLGFSDFSYKLQLENDTFTIPRTYFDSATQRYLFTEDTIVDSTEKSSVLHLGDPRFPTNLTLHNEFSNNRYLDFYFNNVDRDQVPKKEIYYRGNSGDVLQDIRLGKNDFSIPSLLLPQIQYEGGSLTAESQSKLATRDRKRVRSVAGGGFSMSSEKNEILVYRSDGQYRLSLFSDTLSASSDTVTALWQPGWEIVKGSLEIYVDGAVVDSTQYTFGYKTGILVFNTQNEPDPASVIRVSYRARPLPPGGYTEVEWIPQNRVGDFGYTFISLSASDWFFPRAGYMRLGENDWVNVDASSEWRSKSSNLFLKADPEISLVSQKRAGAGALTLYGRLGQSLGISFKGLFADTDFASSRELSRGFGSLKNEVDGTVSYDVLPEIPFGFRQYRSESQNGTELRSELSAQCRFANWPFLDILFSRNKIDATPENFEDSSGLAFNRQKDKIQGRLYELTSQRLADFFHLSRFGYDFSAYEFQSQDSAQNQTFTGSRMDGKMMLSPISPIAVTLASSYHRNSGIEPSRRMEPSIQVQTINAPPGIDLNAKTEWDLEKYSLFDSTNLELVRTLGIVLKPGIWYSPFKWMSPRAFVSQRILCGFATQDPDYSSIFAGQNFAFKTRETLSKMVGLHIFPSDKLYFRNENTWTNITTLADTAKFSSLNDCKLWIGQGDLWQTRWQMDVLPDRKRVHSGYSRYDKIWTHLLSSRQGLYATYTVDSLKIGPQADLNLNKDRFFFFKSILNTHSLGIDWVRKEGHFRDTPNLLYTLYLRMVIKPNLVLESNNSVLLQKDKDQYFNSWSGKISAQAIF